jgi:RimJ/RimL family protein N-acetyltransferase
MKINIEDGLYLYPLSSEELSLWLNNISELEEKLNCTYCAEPLEGILKDSIQSQFILGMSENIPNWIWYTYWFLIRETDNKIIGFLSFKGKPTNDTGKIEIGYSLGKDFEHKGYMTKAVMSLCNLAEQYPEVKKINALTLTENTASQRLLIRCGFRKFSETPSSFLFIRRVHKS